MSTKPEASREEKVHAALARACRGDFSDDVLVAGAEPLLTQLHPDDAKAIRAGGPRFWLYRELVRNNMQGVVRSLAPRAAALFDARAPGVLPEIVDAFLREEGVRSHYFRDVPFEMFAWARPALEKDARIPPLLIDLMAWELFRFEVTITPRASRPEALFDVSPDRALLLEAPAKLARFGCRVHEWLDDAPDPAPAPTILLGYRDAERRVMLLELTPLAAAIVRELQAGKPLARAIPDACAAESIALSQDVLASAAKLLADLSAAGIILGAV